MKTPRYVFALLLVAGTQAHANGDVLMRVDHCQGSRTTDARAECEKRWKDAERAFRREQQQKRIDDSRADKRNSLCFTRKATNEVVCPN